MQLSPACSISKRLKVNYVENVFGKILRIIRSGQGEHYIGNNLSQYINEFAVKESPKPNGLTERKKPAFMETASLIGAKISKNLLM